MTRARGKRGSACWLWLSSGATALACGGAATFPTVDPHVEPPPRRAPAIAIDPAQRLSEPEQRGSTQVPLLVLFSPWELGAVHAALQRFFRAMVSESTAELDALLLNQAWLDATSGRAPARNALRARLAQLDFTPLRGVMLYREHELEIYRAADAPSLALARSLSDELRANEVFVRVRLTVSHAGKVRLFSDELGFTLRSDARGFRIARIVENTQVP